MKYKGSKLKMYVKQHRGAYTDICTAILGGKKKGLDQYYHDDHNISIEKLSALMAATGLPIDFFCEFAPGELPQTASSGVTGNNNIVNSMVGSDLAQKVEHLNEVIHLKDQLLAEKDTVIAMKDSQLELWKKRYDDALHLAKFNSDETRT